MISEVSLNDMDSQRFNDGRIESTTRSRRRPSDDEQDNSRMYITLWYKERWPIARRAWHTPFAVRGLYNTPYTTINPEEGD